MKKKEKVGDKDRIGGKGKAGKKERKGLKKRKGKVGKEKLQFSAKKKVKILEEEGKAVKKERNEERKE